MLPALRGRVGGQYHNRAVPFGKPPLVASRQHLLLAARAWAGPPVGRSAGSRSLRLLLAATLLAGPAGTLDETCRSIGPGRAASWSQGTSTIPKTPNNSVGPRFITASWRLGRDHPLLLAPFDRRPNWMGKGSVYGPNATSAEVPRPVLIPAWDLDPKPNAACRSQGAATVPNFVSHAGPEWTRCLRPRSGAPRIPARTRFLRARWPPGRPLPTPLRRGRSRSRRPARRSIARTHRRFRRMPQ